MGKQKGLLQSMQSEVDQCYQQMKTNLQQQTCLQKAYLSDKEGQMIFQRPTMLESV